MTRGIYAAAAAMISQMLKQDVLANNLANVNTIGFKADRITFASFPEMLQKKVNEAGTEAEKKIAPQAPSSVTYPEATIDPSPGALQQTGNPLDVALPPGVCLTLETPQGTRYTRQGNLRVGTDGTLESAEGFKVMGLAGSIRVQGKNVQVRSEGDVVVDGSVVDKLALVRFPSSRQVAKEGNGLLVGVQAAPATGAELTAGYLELSNVNPVRTLAEMITTIRTYEAAQRSIQLQDETLGRAMEVMRTA